MKKRVATTTLPYKTDLAVATAALGRRRRLSTAATVAAATASGSMVAVRHIILLVLRLLLRLLLLLLLLRAQVQLIMPGREGQRDALGRRHVLLMLVRVLQDRQCGQPQTRSAVLFCGRLFCLALVGEVIAQKGTKRVPKNLPRGSAGRFPLYIVVVDEMRG